MKELVLGFAGIRYGGRAWIAGLAVLSLLAAFLAACGGGNGKGEEATGTPTSEAVSAGLLTPTNQDILTAEDLAKLKKLQGQAIRGEFKGDRLVIPDVGIDAPLTKKTVPADGVMPNPDGPTDVAWYDFSAFDDAHPDLHPLGGVPGIGGNSVFAGHVDYHDYGPAVFWRLRELTVGQIIEIHMSDGKVLKYAVQLNKEVNPDAVAWEEVLAATADESISLLSCAGTFDSSTRQYNNRQLVVAKRVE